VKPKLTTWDEAGRRLAAGEIGVLPSDTLYGLMASALKPAVVERIYDLRQRDRDKALIVLLGDVADLTRFQVKVPERAQELFGKVWPGPVSVIVPVPSPEWHHVHRGLDSIAFRVPAKPELRRLLREVGPLVAPSANLAGEEPSWSVEDAYRYFGESVFYVDEGRLEGSSSALVDARFDPPKILRPAPGFRI
jgi:L-threonylcarbamoyladenylate synthase